MMSFRPGRERPRPLLCHVWEKNSFVGLGRLTERLQRGRCNPTMAPTLLIIAPSLDQQDLWAADVTSKHLETECSSAASC
jgi:hypothetical protein